MEGVYSKAWLLGKREGFRKCEKNSGKVWGKVRCKSKKIREIIDRTMESLRMSIWRSWRGTGKNRS